MKTALALAGGGLLGAGAALAVVFLGDAGYKQKFEKLERDYQTLASKKTTDADALAASREEVSKLRDEIDSLTQQLAVVGESNAAAAAAATRKEKPRKGWGNAFEGLGKLFETMGSAQSKFETKKLRELLGLTGAQGEEFEALLAQSADARKAAFAAVFSGKGTFEQFARMEGATPDLDRFVAENLDADRQAAYAEYKAQQNQDRIERKANEELMWLQSVTQLDSDQKDQAFAIFADQATREKPERMLDMSGPEEFNAYIDTAMGERKERLGEVLDADQLSVYTEQAEVWTNMAKTMASGSQEQE